MANIIIISNVVHRIISLNFDSHLSFFSVNWQELCNSCGQVNNIDKAAQV